MRFRRTKTLPQKSEVNLPTGPVEYPAGIAVRSPSGDYFINKDGKRYRIPTQRVFDSWKFPLVVKTSDEALSNYPVAVTKLGFRDGSLLNNIADGKLYLVSEGKLRHIVNPDFFGKVGLEPSDAVVVSDAEINSNIMKFGEVIY